MGRRILFLALFSGLLGSPLFGDWLLLKDGSRVRGIDLKKKGGGYLFCVETGKTVFVRAEHFAGLVKSPPGEKVEFRGEKVTLRRKILTLKRENRKREKKLFRAVETWARGGKKAPEARCEVLRLAPREREVLFGKILVGSGSAAARILAAVQLGTFKTKHAVKSPALAGVLDRASSVRSASLKTLEKVEDRKAGRYFVPFLISRNKSLRIRASEALRSFPTYRAVPALLITITKIWGEGQRSYFFQGAQRAYVADYEVVSGGTTFTLTEVADPIVRFNETGVVLDAKIAKTEQRIHLTTLEKITGKDFGRNIGAWKSWWKAEGMKLAFRELGNRTEGERGQTRK